MLLLAGQKWYYKLVTNDNNKGKRTRALMDDYPITKLVDKLVIALIIKSPKYSRTNEESKMYLYSCFGSYVEFGVYMSKFPVEERCFFEIVIGQSPQKSRFDIDVDRIKNPNIDNNEIITNLVENINEILSQHKVNLDLEKDILVFNSHSPKKLSNHVIINNYYHINNLEAKAFYDLVINKMNPKLAEFVDHSVYKPTQQFRIVGCKKMGSSPTKVLEEIWRYGSGKIAYEYIEKPTDNGHKLMLQLEASLLTYVRSCQMLPEFITREQKQLNTREISEETVTLEEAHQALNLYAAYGGITVSDKRFPYKFLGIKNNLLLLKRVKASKCPICTRIHEHENTFLSVVGEDRAVYFYCHRAPNKRLFVGNLQPSKFKEISTQWINTVVAEEQNILDLMKNLAKGPSSDTKESEELEADDKKRRRKYYKKSLTP